jgi:hypothetical protein
VAKRARSGTTVDQARAIALALPDAAEAPSYGTPGFRARGKLFARLLPDGESLVVRVEPDQRDLLLAGDPAVFSVTPHYLAYPWVIVKLAAVDRGLLAELLAEAAQLAAPPKPRGRRRPSPR